MRKVLLFILVFTFFSVGNITPTYVADKNTVLSVKKIELIENYISSHKKKIELFGDKYEIKNNSNFQSYISDMKDMILILQKLKNSNKSKDEVSEIVLKVVKELKNTNIKLRPILEKHKALYETELKNKKNAYSSLGKRVSMQLNKLIQQVALLTKKKDIATSEKRKIADLLREIEQNSKVLASFGNRHFEDTKVMKSQFLQVLKNIKEDMTSIKFILSK